MTAKKFVTDIREKLMTHDIAKIIQDSMDALIFFSSTHASDEVQEHYQNLSEIRDAFKKIESIGL